MTKSLLIIVLILLYSGPARLHADVVAGLYSAVVPVADHSEKEKRRALKQGLLNVLVKITGTQDIESRSEVTQLLSSASQYVVSFGYKDIQEEDYTLALSVRYGRDELDRFVRQHQLPVWPASRPSLLVWVVSETPGEGQKFLSAEDAPDVYKTLDTLFDSRGLPIRYPLLDLQDQLALSIDDAWALRGDAIDQASSRYTTPGWLLIRAYQTSNLNWKSAWLLSLGENDYFNELDSLNIESVLTQVGNDAVDRVAANFIYISSSVAGQLSLSVTNVGNYQSFSELISLFEGLSMVNNVNVSGVNKTTVTLVLDIEGDIGPLFETLALSNKLAIPESLPVPGSQIQLGWLAN